MTDWRNGLADAQEPWTPAQATERIRVLGHAKALTLNYTVHARDRLTERDLVIGDILHLLKRGFVYESAQPTTRPTCFKYLVEGKTPNSGGRSVRAVVIPDWRNCECKIVTVMWVDEAIN